MLLVDDEISLLSSFAINVASIELGCTIAHIIPFAVTDKPIVLVFYPSYWTIVEIASSMVEQSSFMLDVAVAISLLTSGAKHSNTIEPDLILSYFVPSGRVSVSMVSELVVV